MKKVLIAILFLIPIACNKVKDDFVSVDPRTEIFSKPQKVFSGHIGPTSSNVEILNRNETTCNFDITYQLFYSIVSLPCGTSDPGISSGTTNDYRFDFVLVLETDPSYCSGPKNVNQDPILTNLSFKINNITVGASQNSPTPWDGCGHSISGSVKFTEVDIFCDSPTIDIDVTGSYSSSTCSPAQNFAINNISPDLEPSVCPGSYYATGITAEIYPNVSFDDDEFLVYFPWDNLCFNPCFVPTGWSQIEIEYYKSPSGTHYFTSANYFPSGPMHISVTTGSGTYYSRARYKCSGGVAGPWSDWKSVPVF